MSLTVSPVFITEQSSNLLNLVNGMCRSHLRASSTPNNKSLPIPDHCESSSTVRDDTAAMDAALEQAGLAEDLALLAAALELQGFPCAAEAF